jgi:DNA-binding NarL/FixJ family response regulator
MAAIRVLLVEDHELVRSNLSSLLASNLEFAVVSEASSGFEAVRKAEECQPDVIVLDISIPDLNGIQAAPVIRKIAPHAEILVVTQYDCPFIVREAFAAGARGFLTKSDAGSELLTAVRTVHSKKKFVSRSIGTAGLSTEVAKKNAANPAASSE